MKIIVVGAGTVGANIARFLSRDRFEVVVVDMSRPKLNQVEDQLDVQVVQGNACDPHILRILKIDKTDLLLAVTEKDETNMICAMAAKTMGCHRVIARVRSRFYYDTTEVNFRQPLGIDLLISPEISTALELANFVSFPNALAITTLARGRIQIRTIRLSPDSAFVGKKIMEIKVPPGMLIGCLRRDQQVMIARGGTVLEGNDRVTFIGLPEVIHQTAPLFDLSKVETRLAAVGIAGAGETGLFLAEILEKRGHKVTLIENNAERAEIASNRLRSTKVLHGDATDVNFLREEGLGSLEYFIAMTGDDENNIMSCLLAKEVGVEKTACLIDRPDYTRIVERIGIDVAISPRFVVANRVMAMVKQGRISSVTLMEDGEIEVNEYQALAQSPIVGQPLRDMTLPSGALIGAVLQGGEVVIPRGDYVIKPGSIVIGLATPEDVGKLDDLFSKDSPT